MKNIFEMPARLDEDIHKVYSGITKRWEDKGRSKYSLSGIFDAVASLNGLIGGALKLPISFAYPFAFFNALSTTGSICGYADERELENEEDVGVVDPFLYHINKFGRVIRTPELIGGLGFMGKGVYDVYNTIANNDSSSLVEGVGNLSLGLFLASNASAYFVRDSDPKSKDRKFNFVKGLEKLTESVKGLAPEGVKDPVPVKLNYEEVKY